MATEKVKSKTSAAKAVTAKSKKPVKASKSKVALAKINMNIPKPLHVKIKRLSLKNKITIQDIVTAAIKEYVNKPAVLDAESAIKTAV